MSESIDRLHYAELPLALPGVGVVPVPVAVLVLELLPLLPVGLTGGLRRPLLRIPLVVTPLRVLGEGSRGSQKNG